MFARRERMNCMALVMVELWDHQSPRKSVSGVADGVRWTKSARERRRLYSTLDRQYHRNYGDGPTAVRITGAW